MEDTDKYAAIKRAAILADVKSYSHRESHLLGGKRKIEYHVYSPSAETGIYQTVKKVANKPAFTAVDVVLGDSEEVEAPKFTAVEMEASAIYYRSKVRDLTAVSARAHQLLSRPSSAMMGLLRTSENVIDGRRLEALVDIIVSTCTSHQHERETFDEWSSTVGIELIRQGKPIARMILEAAAMLQLASLPTLIAKALDDCPDHETVLIAAQRIRAMPGISAPVQANIGVRLRKRIEEWERDRPDDAAVALPSMAYVYSAVPIVWFQQRITDAPRLIAWGCVLGVLDWASGSTGQALAPDVATLLLDSVQRRYASEPVKPLKPDLPAVLVWTAGALATESRLDSVAAMLVAAFERGAGTEDAASVRAARVLARRWKDVAIRHLRTEFERRGSDQLDRFLSLLA